MTDENNRLVTGAEAGLSGDGQIIIALREIIQKGGKAQISEIYAAVDEELGDYSLSEQGKASLRRLVNSKAVRAGYLYSPDPENPGWRITPEGQEFLETYKEVTEHVIDVDTGSEQRVPIRALYSQAFEMSVLELVKALYPDFSWYHQGRHKSQERGLDLIGTHIGSDEVQTEKIGVQVKFHSESTAPRQDEWLKFLAGCFARRVDKAIFVITGRLTANQRREAGEADVIVIQGVEELVRLAERHEVDPEIFTQILDDMTESEG